jgi:Tol biopolymer transport system component
LALSPSGDLLLFREDTPTGNHLQILRMDGKSQGEALLQLTFGENNADISPDGRWLAYQRRQSGRNQIEVTPFPNAEGGRWLVADGQKPRWSPKGDELFYLDDGLLMRVAVQTSPSFSAGAPTKVLSTRYFNTAQGRTWDVAADGQRFVMLKDAARSEPSTTPNSMVVVVNWAEELKARVPARK